MPIIIPKIAQLKRIINMIGVRKVAKNTAVLLMKHLQRKIREGAWN